MAETRIAVNFKDMATKDELKDALQWRCEELGAEFPELHHLEVTITPDGDGFAASAHGTGKSTEIACHTRGAEPGQAADRIFDSVRQQLRRAHDRKIFKNRRTARKQRVKRIVPEAAG